MITIRRLRKGEARLFLELHTRSIRGLAAGHYPPEVIDAWTVPINDLSLRFFEANPDDEIRLIAELDGDPVGLGALVLESSELRACYVAPEAVRKGVGSAIVREIERLAIENGLDRLDVLASINSESFYSACGYVREEETTWHIRGQPMAAVRMSKKLLK